MDVTLKLAGAKPLLLSSIDAADPRSRAYRKMAELRKVKSANRTPSGTTIWSGSSSCPASTPSPR